jgi:hypothetical protein
MTTILTLDSLLPGVKTARALARAEYARRPAIPVRPERRRIVVRRSRRRGGGPENVLFTAALALALVAGAGAFAEGARDLRPAAAALRVVRVAAPHVAEVAAGRNAAPAAQRPAGQSSGATIRTM